MECKIICLSAPPIPPRIQLSRIQSGDSNTKEKQSKSGKGCSLFRSYTILFFSEINVTLRIEREIKAAFSVFIRFIHVNM